MSHGEVLGLATQKTTMKGRNTILIKKRMLFLFSFDIFPVLFGVVTFLTATEPRYNPQHKHRITEWFWLKRTLKTV